jgi:hypothetical protein
MHLSQIKNIAYLTLSVSAVGNVALEFEGDHPLVIRKPAVLISEDWEILLSN